MADYAFNDPAWGSGGAYQPPWDYSGGTPTVTMPTASAPTDFGQQLVDVFASATLNIARSGTEAFSQALADKITGNNEAAERNSHAAANPQTAGASLFSASSLTGLLPILAIGAVVVLLVTFLFKK